MDVFTTIFKFRNVLLSGLAVTIELSIILVIGGTIVGALAATVMTAKGKSKRLAVLKKIVRFYVTFFRSAPLLILLFFGYYGLGYLGISIDAFSGCATILILYSGAYICEVIRSGIEAIPKGQFEAGYCVGLNYIDVMRFIIFPQAAKIFVPALIGEYTAIIKDTTVVSLIGCSDLVKQTQVITNKAGQALQLYLMIALVFFIICYPLSLFAKKLENRSKSV